MNMLKNMIAVAAILVFILLTAGTLPFSLTTFAAPAPVSRHAPLSRSAQTEGLVRNQTLHPSLFPQRERTNFEALCTGTNLLTNPSFEGSYSSYIPPGGHPDCNAGICTTAQMANGWTPWWRSHNPQDDGWIFVNPEYKPAEGEFFPDRVHDGDFAQQYFSFSSTHRAGIYQKVPAVSGQTYRFCIWGHAWYSLDDDLESDPDWGVMNLNVGIDPYGGTEWPVDGSGSNIVWAASHTQYDEYGLFMVETEAKANQITVYTFSEPQYAAKHNDVYWDDATLISLTPTASELAVTVNGDLNFVADLSTPVAITRTVDITITNGTGIDWWAWTFGGTLTPTLSAGAGTPGTPLTISVDSHGFATGVYTTTLNIAASDAATTNSPIKLPVSLLVADFTEQLYLPLITKN